MSDNCNNKNPLQRDGTSQAQRLLAALLPSYVSVDERKLEDLVAFTKRFATQVNYFNLADAPDGDWVGFFTKTISEDQRTEPHYALFIAFLRLFAIAQDDLNTITQRHLDFYYREVLNLQEKPAVPDQVYIIFTLAEQLNNALIAKGKALDAKKDDTGVDLVYDTDKDIVVNQGKVEQLKAVFINRPLPPDPFDPRYPNAPAVYPDLIPQPDPTLQPPPVVGNEWRLYASPIANSADGLGADIETTEKRWRTFGRPNPLPNSDNQPAIKQPDRAQAEIGFGFASPLLFLAEGTRTVTITINSARPSFGGPRVISQLVHATLLLSSTPATRALSQTLRTIPVAQHATAIANLFINQNNAALNNAVNVYFSGEEGWIIPDGAGSAYYDNQGNLVITRTITKGQKAVVAYDETVLLQPFKTEWPVVKVTLNTENPAAPYIYQDLCSKALFTATLEVDVVDVKNVIVQSEDSVLATEKPFTPFGSRPVVGSTFYIGSNEIFQKQLSSLNVNITWHGLPDATMAPHGFQDYYKNYIPDYSGITRQTSKFKVITEILDKQSWQSLYNPQVENKSSLFQSQTAFNASPVDDNASIQLSNGFAARDPKMEPVTEFTATTKKGFMRMTLADVDFGSGVFQNSYAQQAIWLSSTVSTPPPGVTAALPNDPYIPTIKEISVNYTSKQTINLTHQVSEDTNKKNYENRVEQFFHVLPFGVTENHPYITKQTHNINLLPQFEDEGNLYIGVSGLVPPSTLSVLFKVAEGSSDPDLEKQPVKWSYMLNNEWYEFTQLQVLSDGTNGLLTSGIVTFDLPKVLNNTNTALPTGQFWLRASVEHNSAAVCDMIAVIAQAVTATFVDNGNDPNHLRTPLPAETISDFVESDAAIDKISQPYSSFGGHIKEQSNEFYTRVSERLRHKNRAITIWDYEHLVLEKFPNIYKVKCLNHTRYTSVTDIQELIPGHVSLVIISNLHNNNVADPLEPKTSLITLTEISDYIKTINPPCVELHVRNPIFEQIQVNFNVRFLPGYDNGFYGQLLETEIKQFLAPWAYNTKDIVFGGVIHKSMLINFVEERPYVDFVTCFNMDQIIPTGKNTLPITLKNIEEAVTSTSASILTSAHSHKITVLETDDCKCDDNLIIKPMLNPDQPCDECGVDNKEKSPTGIGADEILTTFIIGHKPRTGIDYWAIEKDFEVQ